MKMSLYSIAQENLNEEFIEDYTEQGDLLEDMSPDYDESRQVNLLSQEIEQSLILAGTIIDIKDELDKNQSIDSVQARVITQAIEGLIKNQNISIKLPALESYGLTKSRTKATSELKLSLEGIIKDIWEKIKAAFKKIMLFLSKIILVFSIK